MPGTGTRLLFPLHHALASSRQLPGPQDSPVPWCKGSLAPRPSLPPGLSAPLHLLPQLHPQPHFTNRLGPHAAQPPTSWGTSAKGTSSTLPLRTPTTCPHQPSSPSPTSPPGPASLSTAALPRPVRGLGLLPFLLLHLCLQAFPTPVFQCWSILLIKLNT